MTSPIDKSTLIQGCDLSSYEPDVNWEELAKAKKFVFLRVSHGVEVKDVVFQRFWKAAKQHGVIRGAYHYLMPNQPIQPQIDYFISAVGALEVGDLPPVLDLEEPEIWQHIAQADRVPLVLRFLEAMEKAFGVTPMLYCSPSFIPNVLGTANAEPLKRFPLWIANYRVAQPTVPKPWDRWTFWQFTPEGKCPGFNGTCDLNVFNGTAEDLRALTVQSILPAVEEAGPSFAVQGCDISSYQSEVDWKKVATAKAFAFIRASHGTAQKDAYFLKNWRAAKEAGVIRGAYHYLDPTENFQEQLDYFTSVVGQLEVGDLPPVVDAENAELWKNIPKKDRIKYLLKFCSGVEAKLGVRPIIYLSPSFVDGVIGAENAAPLKNYILWIANYRVSEPRVPAPWTEWTFWQYSDRGRTPGVEGDCDQDAFSGSLDDLKKLTVQSVFRPANQDWNSPRQTCGNKTACACGRRHSCC